MVKLTIYDVIYSTLHVVLNCDGASLGAACIVANLDEMGYAIVPKEATQAICEAYWNGDWGCPSDPSTPEAVDAWASMVEAATKEC